MSKMYDEYMQNHKDCVYDGYKWFVKNAPEAFLDEKQKDEIESNIKNHDASKSDMDEYAAYDAYFYGGNRSYDVVKNFERAWLMHIHKNKHHWQHWVLINDDPNVGVTFIDIPYVYIFEMVCDWWAFSWAHGDLYSIFSWYDKHRNYIKMHENSRDQLESLLELLKNKLDEIKEKGEAE